jgi:hypothetical protein
MRRMKLASRRVGPQIGAKTDGQKKALDALKSAALHADKIGNPEMAWVAAGACGLHGASFNSLVEKGYAERRYAPCDAARRYDYRLTQVVK